MLRPVPFPALIGYLFLSSCFAAIEPGGTPLDRVPTATQKPYHPVDGQTVEITPPPFIWVPAAKDAIYALQVSRSDQFADDTTRAYSDLKRCVFVPREPLPPGQWFWRWGVQSGRKTTWSRARSFTVPASARPFPFPDFDKVIRAIPQARPRLFFTGPQLQRVRDAANGELKEEVAELVRACRKAVDAPLVLEPGYEPKEASERGPWAINVMRTTRPPMDLMERCALAYLITGDRALGLEAKRRLLHFFSWDPEGPTSFFAYDEPPMWMMMRGTRTYDWTYDLFSPEQRTKIEKNMKARAAQFAKRLQSMPFESSPFESHAGRLPGFLGECAISFAHEWPEARPWLEYATLLYYTSYPAWGGDDGGWQEGPHYWSAYMNFALHFVTALRSATGVDLMNKPFFRNTPYYCLYTATPYHEHTPFGDGQNGPPSRGQGAVMYAFSSLTQNPYFRWYAQAIGYRPGEDVLSLATYDPTLQPKTPLDLPQSRTFPGVGLVSMHTALGDRENDIGFLLRSSPYGSTSHGHADQNAFTLEAFGRGLAIATGYYPWYGSPHHHDWTRATRAVNSILIDQQGQERRSYQAKGTIVAFQASSGYDYAEAEAAPAYGDRLKTFRRHVVHVRPGVFILYDNLVAPKPATSQWLLHSYDRIAVDSASRTLRIERSPAAMNVHLLHPTQLVFSQTDQYTPPPEETTGKWTNTWHLTASTQAPATNNDFLAVLLPHRAGQAETLPKVASLEGRGAVGVRLTYPDGRSDVVAFRTNGAQGEVTCGTLKSDARVFALSRDAAGRPRDTLLVGGARLLENGREIAPRP